MNDERYSKLGIEHNSPSSLQGLISNIISNPITPSGFKAGTSTHSVGMKDTNIGGSIITIDTTQDIQKAIDSVSASGGGTVNLLPGTYYPKNNIIVPSSVKINGQSETSSVVSFRGQNFRFVIAGTNVYTTGVIVNISNSVIVSGSGTSWLANVKAGQHLFLGTRWYEIAVVAGDTTLILAEGYSDNLTLPTTYRIATVARDIDFSNFSVVSSTAVGGIIDFDDARNVSLSQFIAQDANVGITFTNVSESLGDAVLSLTHTGDGVQITNSGLFNTSSFASISNGGYGWKIKNLKTATIFQSAADGNTKDGFICTSVVSGFISVEVVGNGGNGINFASACSSIGTGVIQASGNTLSGINFGINNQNNTISTSFIMKNSAYGVNVSSANNYNTLILGNNFQTNTSGAVNNSGTGTLIRSNIGVADSP